MVFVLLANPAVVDAHSLHQRAPAKGGRAPASTKKEATFVESRPADIGSYLQAGRTPKYLRVNVSGYNVRTSPDFAVAKTDNIDFKSSAGSLFAVSEIRRLKSGVAAAIFVDGKKRWLFVPYFRKSDFQFCESEACFADMAESLDLLISPALGLSKPIICGPENLAQADTSYSSDAAPAPRARPVVARLDSRIPATSRSTQLKVAPAWEIKKGALGATWTRQLQDSLKKYGATLLNTRKFRDQNVFCPNYSSLSASERAEFWVHMFSAIAMPESHYVAKPGNGNRPPVFDEATNRNPASGYINDHGASHYSMGLLALTYKYNNNVYQPYCGAISARKDFGKSIWDPSLTIYNTQNQFDCAVGIMSHSISRWGDIGYYRSGNGGPAWSTVRATNADTRGSTLRTLRRYTPCFSRKGSL